MTSATPDQAADAVAQQASMIRTMRAESEARLAAYYDRARSRAWDDLRHRWERA